MGKFSNTWRIMKASWWILKQDKELLVFPVFSGVAAALILVSFALPIIGAGVLDTIGQREGVPVGLFVLVAWTGSGATIATVIVVGAIYLIGLALVQSTLQAIFQAAVYHYAVEGTAPSGFDTELLEGSFRKR